MSVRSNNQTSRIVPRHSLSNIEAGTVLVGTLVTAAARLALHAVATAAVGAGAGDVPAVGIEIGLVLLLVRLEG